MATEELFEEVKRRLDAERQAIEDEIRQELRKAGERAIKRITEALESQQQDWR